MPINHNAMKGRQVMHKEKPGLAQHDAAGTSANGKTPTEPDAASFSIGAPAIHHQPGALPPVYYDPTTKDYYHRDARGGFVRVSERNAEAYLLQSGYAKVPKSDGPLPGLDGVMSAIRSAQNVDYIGALAGYPVGHREVGPYHVLITRGANPVRAKQGKWSLLRNILQNGLGTEQLDYFFGWLKQTLEMYRDATFIPGHILGLCGPANSGKSLLKDLIVAIVGGREAQSHLFMSGESQFNSQLFESEILAIDDEAESIDGRSRAKFASAIKRLAVSETQMCHPKGRPAMSLRPLWRVIVCVNDEPEAMQVLPPIRDGLMDKIMLLKFEKHAMPLSTKTPSERKAFWAALLTELPALAHHAANWQIPPELSETRFGVAAFHHPDLMAALNETSSEYQLFGMIDKVLFPTERGPEEWTGFTADLYDMLTREDSPCSGRARAAFRHMNTFGAALAALGRQHPSRFLGHKSGGYMRWTIRRSEASANRVDPSVAKQVGLQRLREALAARREEPEQQL